MDQPSKISIVPSFRVTIAFFQFGRVPTDFPTRFALPRMFEVHTPATFTAKRRSIACRICPLLASLATSKVYSPFVWYASEVFSVITGRTIVSCSVGIAYFSFFFGAAFFAALFFAAGFFAADFAVAFFAALFFAAGAFAAVFFAAAFRALFF